jgi:hypothetical protein
MLLLERSFQRNINKKFEGTFVISYTKGKDEEKMGKKTMKCPRGQKPLHRWRKIQGGSQLISGCSRKGKFVKVKEIRTIKGGEVRLKKLNGGGKSGLADIGLGLAGIR